MRCSRAIPNAAFLLAAAACAAIPSPAAANPSTSYAFAQQKVYGMTLSAAPGSSATISGDPAGFAVKMSTDASIAALGLGVSFNGGLDPRQSFVTPALPAAPVENYAGNAPAGFSTPAGERVLLQHPLITTAAGVPIAIPVILSHRFLTSRVEQLALEMEEFALRLVDLLGE